METEPSRSVERVRVAVRVRPRNTREQALETQGHAVDVDAASGHIYVCKKKAERSSIATGSDTTTDRELRCHYDRVFDASASQDDVFDYVRDAVQQIAQGFNCTIFAYGQTGTGKTHTMLGRDLEKHCEAARETWGVIPRAVESLFEELHAIAHHGAAAAVVHCSYMQIYNNDVYDLLQENPTNTNAPLAVREQIKGNHKHMYVSGLSEFRVTNLDETLRLLHVGNKNRRMRATAYNEKSSRSHALLQLSAEVESRGAEGPTTIIRRAKLSLVDLAGSEKWDTDVSIGSARCKELTSINQSLSALGNVISALANPKRSHIPYRDSKLTRLLQDSLGGNTRTTVIATISQDASAIEETMSTLQFADRAKCVTLRVRANEMVDDAVLLAQARREIARLRLLLKRHASSEQHEELEQKLAKLTRENAALVSENKRLKQQHAMKHREREKGAVVESSIVSSTGGFSESQGVALQSVAKRVEKRDRVVTPTAAVANGGIPRPPATPGQRASGSQPIETTASQDADEFKRLREEQHQTLVLAQIQSERRALEQELERIQVQHTPRRLEPTDEMPHTDNNTGGEDDDELCPMCRRLIDDHNDDELDACIERETAVITKQETQRPGGHAPSHRATTTATVTPVHLPPRTPPPARKTLAPRTTHTVKKPASPYLHDPVFSTPQAPPTHNNLTRQRRSVRDLAQMRSVDSSSKSSRSARDGDKSGTAVRPSTADASGSSSSSNNNNHAEPVHLPTPIVHQGSKSVQALKKFQALSPYSTPTKAAKAKTTAAGTNTSDSTTERLTVSLRDIGLALQVYKFRYDCWYPCTVVGFDAKRKLHCCQYEYGDKQWQDLSQTKCHLVGRASE